MLLCKTLRRGSFFVAHLKPSNPCQYLVNQWFVSVAAQAEQQGEINGEPSVASENGDLAGKNAKAYDVLFKEAVGLIERSGDLGGGGEVGDCVGGGLSRRLRELELQLKELREKSGGIDPKLKGNSGGRRRRRRKRKIIGRKVENEGIKSNPNPVSCLHSLFDNKGLKKGKPLEKKEQGGKSGGSKEVFEKYYKELDEREDLLVKELSPEMEVFARHLYDEGYFRDANFLPGNRFDVKGFESAYAQGFLKFAAEMFGRDKQEIAKWLSGSDLKALALFGCPSLDKRVVFAAKSLRTFFQIPENTVCSKCVLRESCKFVNQSVWKSGSKNLKLPSLMRVLTAYALEATPPQLVVTEDIKGCVNRLIKDVINLSKTVQDAA